MTSREAIATICDEVKELLLEKNRKYGDSALRPLNVFSASDPEEGIRVRLDDKLKRVQSGQCDEDEDVIIDTIGYLALLLVPVFIWYLTEFQIKPEERALTALFGDDYRAYCQKVRRWL